MPTCSFAIPSRLLQEICSLARTDEVYVAGEGQLLATALTPALRLTMEVSPPPASALPLNSDPAVAASEASEFTVPAVREHLESCFECVFRFRGAGLMRFVDTEVLRRSND